MHHQVVGLGDSVPAASRCGCAGFVTGVAQRLSQRGHAVAAVNLAAPGATSDNLVDDLTDAHERSVIAGSDVVLVEIGANDINFNALYDSDCLGAVSCWKGDLTNLDANVRSILRTLQGLRSSDPAAIAVLGYWNVGEAGDVGAAEGSVYVRNARALTDAVNDVLERDAAAAGTVYVDTYAAFGSDDSTATGLLAADGDHPNAKGHDILAQAVVTALRAAGH